MECPNKKCKGVMEPEYIVYICKKCNEKGFIIKHADLEGIVKDIMKHLRLLK